MFTYWTTARTTTMFKRLNQPVTSSRNLHVLDMFLPTQLPRRQIVPGRVRSASRGREVKEPYSCTMKGVVAYSAVFGKAFFVGGVGVGAFLSPPFIIFRVFFILFHCLFVCLFVCFGHGQSLLTVFSSIKLHTISGIK